MRFAIDRWANPKPGKPVQSCEPRFLERSRRRALKELRGWRPYSLDYPESIRVPKSHGAGAQKGDLWVSRGGYAALLVPAGRAAHTIVPGGSCREPSPSSWSATSRAGRSCDPSQVEAGSFVGGLHSRRWTCCWERIPRRTESKIAFSRRLSSRMHRPTHRSIEQAIGRVGRSDRICLPCQWLSDFISRKGTKKESGFAQFRVK